VGITGHIITSAAVVGIALAATGSVTFACAAGGSSLLLDLDHLIDYWLIDEQYSLNILKFLQYYHRNFPLKRLLLFHSYEILAILAVVAWVLRSNSLGGVVVGAFIHLGTDIIPRSNSGLWLIIKRYSLGYRWHHGFKSSHLYREQP
jgi:hypothetical protein